jgi:hypothetical protein
MQDGKKGVPGAITKNTGDESRLLLSTLPWRGRVKREDGLFEN